MFAAPILQTGKGVRPFIAGFIASAQSYHSFLHVNPNVLLTEIVVQWVFKSFLQAR